jgi:hypothetical protein
MAHYGSGRRDRLKRQESVTKILVYIMIFVTGWALGWFTAEQTTLQKSLVYKSQNEQMTGDIEDLRRQVTDLRAQSITAQQQLEEERTEFASLIPKDSPIKGLLEQIHAQLSRGVAAERLAYVISAASPPQDCVDPQSKRLVVLTPSYKGDHSTLLIDKINIEASGDSFVNGKGLVESWFDTAKPVKIVFTLSDNSKKPLSGLLPLQTTIVDNGREYRFNIDKGAKSFIKITYDHCAYP